MDPIQQPKISVVILNYNGLQYLKRTLGPVLELGYQNKEVIVVDNGSTDGSLEYLLNRKDIILINSPHVGEKNASCNFGVSYATGEYILLMDDDVILEEKHILENLVDKVRMLPSIGEIGLCFVDEGETRSVSYGFYLNYAFASNIRSMSIKSMTSLKDQLIGFADAKCLFIKKEIWNEVGGYDEHLAFGGDDSDLGIKLWMKGYKNYLYSTSIQTHIGMPERIDTAKFSKKYRQCVRAHIYTIIKNYTFSNMLIHCSTYFIFSFLKSIKQSIKRISMSPFIAWAGAICDLISDMTYMIDKRKEVQRKRVIRRDIFLNIVSPSKYEI